MPQFITPSEPPFAQYLVIGIVFCAIDFTIMFAYAALGSQAVRLLRRSGALWLDRVCGVILLGLATSLAFLRRSNA